MLNKISDSDFLILKMLLEQKDSEIRANNSVEALSHNQTKK